MNCEPSNPPANRLNSASGAYGSQTWIFDGVGNRTSQTIAGVTDTYTYPATNNKVQSVVRNAVTQRSFTFSQMNHAAAGRGWYSVATRNGITKVLRKVPYAGAALAAYELYDAFSCD